MSRLAIKHIVLFSNYLYNLLSRHEFITTDLLICRFSKYFNRVKPSSHQNMSSYNYSQSQMLGLGVAFTILPAAFVGARLFARRIQGAKLGTDDYLIIVACVSTFILLACSSYLTYKQAFSISCCVVQLIGEISCFLKKISLLTLL